jgi:hypothetical protein
MAMDPDEELETVKKFFLELLPHSYAVFEAQK